MLTGYNMQGAAPFVLPGPAFGVIGGPAPGTQNDPREYPPTKAGDFSETSILPHWIRLTQDFFGRLVRRISPNNARLAPDQTYGDNAVDWPAGHPMSYYGSPRDYAQAYSSQPDRPDYGASMPDMFSTHTRSMDIQPAFEIDPPIAWGRQIGNLYEGLNGFQGMRQGFPTWFPVANRSNLSNLGLGTRWGGPSVEYLVVPPDRYRRPNRAQPVRAKTGQSRGNISRASSPPVPMGS